MAWRRTLESAACCGDSVKKETDEQYKVDFNEMIQRHLRWHCKPYYTSEQNWESKTFVDLTPWRQGLRSVIYGQSQSRGKCLDKLGLHGLYRLVIQGHDINRANWLMFKYRD